MKTYVRNAHMFAAPFLDRRKSCPQQLVATMFNQFRCPNNMRLSREGKDVGKVCVLKPCIFCVFYMELSPFEPSLSS